jgi:hypothetical protein
MSQIIKNLASGPVPPSVPTSFVTDYNAAFSGPGVSVPVANIENVIGSSSAIDNDNGIATRANPDSGNNLLVLLTNRVTGSGTSVNGASVDLITVPLAAVPASYRFQVEVVGKETTTGDSVGYTTFGSVKTNGVSATIVETPYTDVDEDAALITATVDFVASGNSGILRVTGVAGTTITYKAVGTYLVV